VSVQLGRRGGGRWGRRPHWLLQPAVVGLHKGQADRLKILIGNVLDERVISFGRSHDCVESSSSLLHVGLQLSVVGHSSCCLIEEIFNIFKSLDEALNLPLALLDVCSQLGLLLHQHLELSLLAVDLLLLSFQAALLLFGLLPQF